MAAGKKRILVFGTFDRLHRGHTFFLKSAKEKGRELIVAVARDGHVRDLKGHKPQESIKKRRRVVAELPYVHKAIICDEHLNDFHVIEKIQPDLIVLGHDQKKLKEALEIWMKKNRRSLVIIRAKKYETDKRN